MDADAFAEVSSLILPVLAQPVRLPWLNNEDDGGPEYQRLRTRPVDVSRKSSEPKAKRPKK